METEKLKKRTKTLAGIWLLLYLLIGAVVLSIQMRENGLGLPGPEFVLKTFLPVWAGCNLVVLTPLAVKVLLDAGKAGMKKLYVAAWIALGFVTTWSLVAALLSIAYQAMT